MFRFSILLVLLLNTHVIFGQHPAATASVSSQNQFTFEHFSQEDGLSQGTVYAITSYDDYMWFGTQDGLNRFDGHNFKTFRARRGASHGLNNSWIQALLADGKERFWIGTVGGLCLYDAQKERFQKFGALFKTNHLIDSVSIEELIEDKRGNIWVMTDEHGVFRIDAKSQTVQPYLKENNNLYGFCLGTDGEVWVSTFKEIYYYDLKKDNFKPIGIKKKLEKYLSAKSLIQSILIDKKGNLWVGTYQEGVFRIKQPFRGGEVSHYVKGNGSTNITSNEIRDFMEDRDGRLWMGTKGGGVSIFNHLTETFVHTTQPEIRILYEDQQGIVWLGQSYNGIDKYDPAKHIFRNIRTQEDMSQNGSVYTIYGKEGDLFIGTTNELVAYSLVHHKFNKELGRSFTGINFEVYSMSEDVNKNLWIVTTDKGLYRFDHKNGFVSYSNSKGSDRLQYFLYSVKALKSAPEVWVGGHRGLERFDLEGQKWKGWEDLPSMKAVASRTVRMMYEDSRQNVWIGTLGYGLLRYNPKTKEVITFDKKNGLTCENIRSILEEGTTLWVGTDCGLFQLDLKELKITRQYSETTALPFKLPNDVIYGILSDSGGNLWLSSNKGLAKFSPEKGLLKTYDITDGLQSNEFNTNCAYKHSDGTMYFGGVNGISYFKPEDLQTNVFIPPVKITGITISDSIYSPNVKEITLPHNENFIDFEFIALNFSNTKKNQYQYRMEGIDPKWVHSGVRRMASYTNLPPGTYTFKVIGSNNDGEWNKEGTSIKITILPPWWVTWWFRSLLILLLAGGIYGLFRYRLAQRLLQREAEIRASLMAQEAERQRFSRELHDGIGANLSLLKMYLSSFGEIEIPMAELKERSEKLLAGSVEEIRRLIHDMHPRNLKEMGLVKAVEDIVGLVNLGNALKVHFMAANVPKHMPEQMEINLFRIVQELLQNAIKHSGAENVWLGIQYDEGKLSLTYRDDGKGFDTLTASSGNGLLNIQNRVALMKGKLHTSSAINDGTSIQIYIY